MTGAMQKRSGTFALNRIEPIHRWYSYVEGYSSCLVNSELDILLYDNDIQTIYDPFGGTGTTLLAASERGIKPYFSESNPFMNNVTQTKINSVYNLCNIKNGICKIKEFQDTVQSRAFEDPITHLEWNGFEKFYDNVNLNQLLHMKNLIETYTTNDTKKILMLVLSSLAVSSSKMIRRGDLRYARESEKRENKFSVMEQFISKLNIVVNDIESTGNSIMHRVTALECDTRNISEENLVDCVITSPPYLNGTNYIRNTKLELKLNGFVNCESDLAVMHSKGIVAGINNVSKRNAEFLVLPEIEPYILKLQPVAYDKRIPIMVASYFNDMNNVFNKLQRIIKNKGYFVMDIGDSQFAGVHIPTHTILAELCAKHGFILYGDEILRERRSKNGMQLSQRLLRFRLNK